MQLYENLEGEDLGIVTTLSAAQLTSQVNYIWILECAPISVCMYTSAATKELKIR